MTRSGFDELLAEVRACRLCSASLADGPRPVLQASPTARLLIAAQAPGRRVHASGIPFDDASGERLRNWTGLSPELFYDPSRVAILPMGFCYPGAADSGDRPPRPECAGAWRARLLAGLPQIELTLVIGAYAQAWHLPGKALPVTEAVRRWQDFWPDLLPLPHPSPRNNGWLKHNRWFESELLPSLRQRIAGLFDRP